MSLCVWHILISSPSYFCMSAFLDIFPSVNLLKIWKSEPFCSSAREQERGISESWSQGQPKQKTFSHLTFPELSTMTAVIPKNGAANEVLLKNWQFSQQSTLNILKCTRSIELLWNSLNLILVPLYDVYKQTKSDKTICGTQTVSVYVYIFPVKNLQCLAHSQLKGSRRRFFFRI